MDALLERLDTILRQWAPGTAERVRSYLEEIIESADRDVLDVPRSRSVEQEVLNLIDESTAG